MMKKPVSYAGVVAILFCMVVMVVSVSAATMEDIVGTWNVDSVTKVKANRVGSDASSGSGEITFGPGGQFVYDDFTGGYTYTGNFSLSPDGKKLTMTLDVNGYDVFRGMLEDWLLIWADDEDVILEDIIIEFDAKGIVISTVKTSKKTNAPTKGKVSAKGPVSALVTDDEGTELGETKFSFTSTITFISKQSSE